LTFFASSSSDTLGKTDFFIFALITFSKNQIFLLSDQLTKVMATPFLPALPVLQIL